MTTILNNNILLLESSQEFKEILINQSTRILSVFARGVQDKDLTAPPSPSNVDNFYIVASGASGAWTGKDNQIAIPAIDSNNNIIAGSWEFIIPINGLRVWVIDQSSEYHFDGVNWILNQGEGHIIQNEGTPLTNRTNLDFVGDNVTVTDDSLNDKTIVTIDVSNKQDTLISGTNIKTINSESLLGSGNIEISGSGGGGLTYSYQSTSFNAANGNSYGVNTTSGIITATLPASPNDGDVVAFSDAASSFGTNNLTIDGNGNNIAGYTDITLTGDNESVQLRYSADASQWMIEEAVYQGG